MKRTAVYSVLDPTLLVAHGVDVAIREERGQNGVSTAAEAMFDYFLQVHINVRANPAALFLQLLKTPPLQLCCRVAEFHFWVCFVSLNTGVSLIIARLPITVTLEEF